MNIAFHNIRRPYSRIDIARMSRTINVTDLLQGLMAQIGIEVCAKNFIYVI